MIISKLKQFIIFDCDQNETLISTLLTPEVRSKIFSIEKVSASGLNFRTWNNSLPNFNSLTPNTIYLVTTKPGQVGYEIPGAVGAENYCKKTTILLNITSDSVTIPSDLKINIFDETKPGSVQTSYMGNNNYLISINKSNINQSNPFNFIFQIRDERVTPVNIKFSLSDQKDYSKSINVSRGLEFLHSDIFSQQSIDIVHNWFIDFWSWYEGGMTAPINYDTYMLPYNEVPQQYNIFSHAIYKIAEVNNLQNNQINDYINSHLQEFKNYCLDKTLFEDYFNKNKPFLAEEDFSSLTSQSCVSKLTVKMRPIIQGTNFLGVSSNVWDCIIQDGLYETAKDPVDLGGISGTILSMSPLINWASETHNRNKFIESRKNDFDCRCFSEATLIYLKNQLKNVCPNASVDLIGITRHALLKVDLGGGSPCCEGEYILEATGYGAGRIYDYDDPSEMEEFYRDYELDKWNRGIETISSWDDEHPVNHTGWEKDDTQVSRMSSIICGCLNSEPANQAEVNLKSMCSHFSDENPGKTQMYDYLKNYYGYGDDNINNPGSNNVSLPNTPQGLGCRCGKDVDCGMGEVCCEQDSLSSFCVPKEDCKPECENNEDCSNTAIGVIEGYCCEGRCKENECNNTTTTAPYLPPFN